MKLSTRIDGLPGLKLALSRIADGAKLSAELLTRAEEVRAAAIAGLGDGVSPETRTGALARSIFVEISSDGAARIGTPLDYGWHLEMGTGTRPAYPWLEPALQNQRGTIITQIRAWLSQSARTASRRS